jgi:hypothetical protein
VRYYDIEADHMVARISMRVTADAASGSVLPRGSL